MAFLSVYLDRSADATSTVVAGYVSRVEDWMVFQSTWLAWLEQYHVPYFHMKEFAHSQKAYKDGWQGQNQKRREFVTGLIKIIQGHTFYSFSASVLNADFADFIRHPGMAQLFGNAFTFCARASGRDIRKWKAENFLNSSIDYVFECGDEGKGELIRIMERDQFPTPIFKPKTPTVAEPNGVYTPFQAADFLAWEVRKALGQVETGIEWDDLRQSMKALSFGLGSWSHHSKEQLEGTERLHRLDAASHLSKGQGRSA